jgi:hypothetical protein
MIVIAEQYARFKQTLLHQPLESAASSLLEFAESELIPYYRRHERELYVSVYTRIEAGSTKLWVTVVASVQALIFYGNIRQSVDYLVKDAKYIAQVVLPEAPKVVGLESALPETTRRRTGVPGELQRLFRKVERKEMSADEATNAAVSLLYRVEGPQVTDEVPNLVSQLSSELHASSRESPTQDHAALTYSSIAALTAQTPSPAPEPEVPVSREVIPPNRRTGTIARRDPDGKIRFDNY